MEVVFHYGKLFHCWYVLSIFCVFLTALSKHSITSSPGSVVLESAADCLYRELVQSHLITRFFLALFHSEPFCNNRYEEREQKRANYS